MKEAPPSMLLRANFDIDQVGFNMEWDFSRKDHNGNPIEGKYAGGIYFTTGETMFVHVSAGGKKKKNGKNPFESFKILDCCLICQPQLSQYGGGRPTVFAPPSPFVTNEGAIPLHATINMRADQFKSWIGGEADKDYYKQTQAWQEHLTVGQIEGRWELSFVLTVEITDAEGGVTQRVFGFDPEGGVGTGMNPP